MHKLLCAALLAAPLACAQMAADKTEAMHLWKVSKDFTLAVADAMPAGEFGFKPDPAGMSFAGLMIHIATSQALRFAQLAGEPMPLKIPKEIPRSEAKKLSRDLLTESFDYCIAKLESFTDDQWNKAYRVDWFDRPEATGRLIVLAMFAHTAHHRGQAEVYLRSKRIQPPEYRF